MANSMEESAARRRPAAPGRLRLGGRAIALALAIAVAPPAWPMTLHGQDASAIGQAIAAACGTLPDPETQAVVAGIVADSVSGVTLPRAEVRLTWPGPNGPDTALVETDAEGFYAFCNVPAGGEVELMARLRISSVPLPLEIEAGMLHVQPILLRLSDPKKPGHLVGRIFDAASRNPVASADVAIEELGMRTLSNAHGYFSFGAVPWGVYTLKVSNLGYGDRSLPVRVAGDLTQLAEIALSTEAVELEGLSVTVRGREARMDIEGLVRRMSVGFGAIIARDVIERRPAARVTDLLREVAGIQVNKRGFETTIEVRGRNCTPNVFVDGTPRMWDPTEGLDFLLGSEVEAVEVYKSWSEIPGEFVRPGQTRPCMAIAVWTRRGG